MAKLAPNSRTSHPLTSDAAGDLMNSSGERDRQALIVARLVQLRPGLTSNEMAELYSDPASVRHKIARRLPDAETLGVVHRAPARKDHYTRRMGLTWQPLQHPLTNEEQ